MWLARAAAAALVSFYHRNGPCSLSKAAKSTLAFWPRRGLRRPSADTLLAYRRRFEHRGRRLAQLGRKRSAAEDEAGERYFLLHDFPLKNFKLEEATLREFLEHYASDKTPAPKNR